MRQAKRYQIKLLGVPAGWKVPRRRWKCPHCKIEGWSRDGAMPVDHDNVNGRRCKPPVS